MSELTGFDSPALIGGLFYRLLKIRFMTHFRTFLIGNPNKKSTRTVVPVFPCRTFRGIKVSLSLTQCLSGVDGVQNDAHGCTVRRRLRCQQPPAYSRRGPGDRHRPGRHGVPLLPRPSAVQPHFRGGVRELQAKRHSGPRRGRRRRRRARAGRRRGRADEDAT